MKLEAVQDRGAARRLSDGLVGGIKMAESRARARRGEKVDVLIIGAGPSGSVAAKHLAVAGFAVVALEQGNWPDANDFPGRRPEFELLSQKQWHPNPNVRDLPRD